MATTAWKLAALLSAVHVGFVVDALRAPRAHTFVFTPLVEVLPGTALDANSGAALQAASRLDVRNVNQAMARYGSTFTVDDLARGILLLPDLDIEQKEALTAIIEAHGAHRAEAIALQKDILDAEAALTSAAEPLRRFASGAPR